ncbi:hypothetical protein BOTBODRAFT_66460 [Botryobasidium botryosum FD-172 SS1]|uniref:Rsm22-domain-containing protein n=1 Tax=Botryobasidium botryosum (strain FD-172 SS1) TaxID=930990 RepID=A0A067MQ51_BOTB1|nr:hypothetical protein BOTBODRAFT_66460 [Botryobasidium botryosum FD-172 SS1]
MRAFVLKQLPRAPLGLAIRAIHTTPAVYHEPLPAQPLEPSLQQLLKDADISLLRRGRHKRTQRTSTQPELDFEPVEVGEELPEGSKIVGTLGQEEVWDSGRTERRSPEAVFGTKRIGMITVPWELETSMSSIIEDSDKHTLRSDAKRLFLDQSSQPNNRHSAWSLSLPESKMSKPRTVTPRDGLAFSAVAMPAHFAAISNVLREVKGRLGLEWAADVKGVVEFGVGSGGGIWAAVNEFKVESTHAEDEHPLLRSSIQHYLGLDNRSGLTAMSQKLLRNAPMERIKLKFEKFWGREGHRLQTTPEGTIALCAFTLSTLPDDRARRMMLREMWATGADVMIVLDHGSREGFKCVADAREYLLGKGKKAINKAAELDSIAEANGSSSPSKLGSHVVAPCPHDGVCPLTLPTARQHCFFVQRLERPSYLRKTKHATRGQEDVQYSYVVLRRGPRPAPVDVPTAPPVALPVPGLEMDTSRRLVEVGEAAPGEVVEMEWQDVEPDEDSSTQWANRKRDIEEMRSEAYSWPRIIYSPIKRSGHVILDTCTKQGHIARHTIPKSQGKVPYYDARKSMWGDLFPWEGKNGPDLRTRGRDTNAPANGEAAPGGLKEGEYDVLMSGDELALREAVGEATDKKARMWEMREAQKSRDRDKKRERERRRST